MSTGRETEGQDWDVYWVFESGKWLQNGHSDDCNWHFSLFSLSTSKKEVKPDLIITSKEKKKKTAWGIAHAEDGRLKLGKTLTATCMYWTVDFNFHAMLLRNWKQLLWDGALQSIQ